MIVTSNYFHIFNYFLESIKDSPSILKNLTVIGNDLFPVQINYLRKIGVVCDTTPYYFEEGTKQYLPYILKLNLDNITKKNKFIYIDADTWVQDTNCFFELSELAEKQGFAACYTPRNKKKTYYQYFECPLPTTISEPSQLNAGVMVFNSQNDFFIKARDYHAHRVVSRPMIEQVSFELAACSLGLDNTIDSKYNYLVGWETTDILSLEKDGFYVNGKRMAIIHNLLSAHQKLQKVQSNKQPICMPILPGIAKMYAEVS